MTGGSSGAATRVGHGGPVAVGQVSHRFGDDAVLEVHDRPLADARRGTAGAERVGDPGLDPGHGQRGPPSRASPAGSDSWKLRYAATAQRPALPASVPAPSGCTTSLRVWPSQVPTKRASAAPPSWTGPLATWHGRSQRWPVGATFDVGAPEGEELEGCVPGVGPWPAVHASSPAPSPRAAVAARARRAARTSLLPRGSPTDRELHAVEDSAGQGSFRTAEGRRDTRHTPRGPRGCHGAGRLRPCQPRGDRYGRLER